MNLGLRMFSFIQQRDVMVVKRVVFASSKYQCGACDSHDGGVYVHLEGVTEQECHCVACGQLYLVILAEPGT